MRYRSAGAKGGLDQRKARACYAERSIALRLLAGYSSHQVGAM